MKFEKTGIINLLDNMSNSKPVINFITTNSRNDYSNRNYKVVLTLTNGMIHIES
jgi:hypothetical protein